MTTGAVQWKLLIATADGDEVHLLKGKLESEGIQCRIETRKEYPGSPNPGRPVEFRAYVPVSEFESSLQVLEDEEADEDL